MKASKTWQWLVQQGRTGCGLGWCIASCYRISSALLEELVAEEQVDAFGKVETTCNCYNVGTHDKRSKAPAVVT